MVKGNVANTTKRLAGTKRNFATNYNRKLAGRPEIKLRQSSIATYKPRMLPSRKKRSR